MFQLLGKFIFDSFDRHIRQETLKQAIEIIKDLERIRLQGLMEGIKFLQSVKITTRGDKELARDLRDMSERLRRELRVAMQRSVLIAEGRIRTLTPVKTGTLRRSIHGELETGNRIVGIVGTPLEYGPFIEFGHRQDPRFGTVRRRRGAARMFQRGLEDVMPLIEREFDLAVERAIGR